MKKICVFSIIMLILLSLCACKRKPEVDESGLIENTIPGASYSQENDSENTEETKTDRDISSSSQTEEKDYVLVYSGSVYYNAKELEEKSDLIITCSYDGVESQIVPDKDALGYANKVYTQQTVKLENVIKGDAPSTVNIRRIGGIENNGNIVESNDPQLISGKKYMVYLSKLSPATSEDKAESYSIIDYFEIDDNGKLGVSIKSKEDASEINELFEKSVK